MPTPSPPKPPSRRRWHLLRHKRGLLALALVLIALGLLLTRLLLPPRVTVFQAERRDLVQTVVASGRVNAVRQTAIANVQLATVGRVLVQEGDAVTRNEVVVLLENQEQEALVRQYRAQVDGLQARLQEHADVTQPASQLAVQEAERALVQAEEELQRTQSLEAMGGASRVSRELAEQRRDDAQSRLQITRAEAQSSARGGDRRAIEAELRRAAAELELALLRLQQMTITAPHNGIVTARLVDPGDVVQPATPLLMLTSTAPREVIIEPDEANYPLFQIGQAALGQADAVLDDTFTLKVSAVLPAVDLDRGTLQVHLEIVEPPDYLVANMTVSVETMVARRTHALAVPRAAIVRHGAPAERSVWLVRSHRVHQQAVRLGIESPAFVEITEGIQAGDLIILQPAPSVRPGSAVRVRRLEVLESGS